MDVSGIHGRHTRHLWGILTSTAALVDAVALCSEADRQRTMHWSGDVAEHKTCVTEVHQLCGWTPRSRTL